eukprot:3057231-Prorocentrum_lima.AAC.1
MVVAFHSPRRHLQMRKPEMTTCDKCANMNKYRHNILILAALQDQALGRHPLSNRVTGPLPEIA